MKELQLKSLHAGHKVFINKYERHAWAVLDGKYKYIASLYMHDRYVMPIGQSELKYFTPLTIESLQNADQAPQKK